MCSCDRNVPLDSTVVEKSPQGRCLYIKFAEGECTEFSGEMNGWIFSGFSVGIFEIFPKMNIFQFKKLTKQSAVRRGGCGGRLGATQAQLLAQMFPSS